MKSRIKKKFFNESKADLNQECEKLFVTGENVNSLEGLKLTEEYIENYRVTTRWQTL
ncbi:MAG TPA: hypothetical protein VK872_06325 [Draconibacterium sp.]|nr:hypothetical protein [Draconibacterium sp.]